MKTEIVQFINKIKLYQIQKRPQRALSKIQGTIYKC